MNFTFMLIHSQLKLPGQNLFPNDNGIPDCFIIEFFRLPLFDFEL